MGQRLKKDHPKKSGVSKVTAWVMPPSYRIWGLSQFLIAFTAIAYMPAWHGGFVWDDDDYVTSNPLLTAPDGLRRIWFSLDSPSQYFPLVYTTFRIERALWDLNPTGYHWVNILLHVANALLVWRLLVRLKVPGAWLAAAIFALHPVQVESVAWITQRKNVLMGFFFLLTMLAWVEFVDVRTRRRWIFYAAALIFYVLALSAKTTACTLPAALLLILWLQKRSINWPRLLQIVPFFLLGLGMGLITVWLERYHQGTRGALFALDPLGRLLVASHAVWFYLSKLFWPSDLTFIYPQWSTHTRDPLAYLWLFATGVLGVGIYFARRCLGRSVEVAALFFFATLSPVLGFIMLYTFRYTFVADHYQYLASIGPIALVSAGIVRLKDWTKYGRQMVWAFGTAIVVVVSLLTYWQSATYRDIETLWRTTIARNSNCWMAHNNLGLLLLHKGAVDEAIAHFEEALEIWPDNPGGHNNLGKALLQKGSGSEALLQFQKALEISPDDADAHNNLGAFLLQEGEVDEAIAHFEKALEQRPAHADAHSNLGIALLQKGEVDEAIVQYQKTLELPFDHAESHFNLGNAFRLRGEIDEAIAHYRKALELRPHYISAYNYLANTLRQKGLLEEAILQYEKALKTEPGSVVIQNNLAWMLATCFKSSLRNGAKAVQLAEEANRLSGGSNPIVLQTLAAAYAENGQFSEAVETAQRALELVNAQGDQALTESLRNEIVLYRAGSPYHETSPLP